MVLSKIGYLVLASTSLSCVLWFAQDLMGTPGPKKGTILEGQELELAASVFEARCAVCHGSDGKGTDAATNLVDGLWKHGGTPAEIERVVSGGVPGTAMKGHREQLTPVEIARLAKYVTWLEKQMHAAPQADKRKEATETTDNVARTLPALPRTEITGSANFIDDYIFGKMKADGIPHAGLCSDADFIRRLYLDVWGRLPDAETVRTFFADKNPLKREKLIDHLLGWDFKDRPGDDDFKGPWYVDDAFLAKWSYFFGDLFENGKQGNGALFREYLKEFLKYDIPYDFVVREMLTATTFHNHSSGASGFLTRQAVGGLRDADVMHEDTLDEIAVQSSKVFLGVKLECVSCHDGAGHLEKINVWLSQRKRVEFWRQAAFFGNMRIFRPPLMNQEFAVIDGPPLRQWRTWQGGIANFEFTSKPNEFGGMGYRMEAPSVLRVPRDKKAEVYPSFILTGERPVKGADPRHEYARMVTTSRQFARATVNLIWSKFMTTGIVDPPLDFDLSRQDPKHPPPAPWTIQPSHPELLEALADDFIRTNYSLRLLMRNICRSKAYQLSSRFEGEYKASYDRYYARKLARRLSAEEIHDAIVKATNVPTGKVKYALELVGSLYVKEADPELERFLAFFGQSNRESSEASTKSSVIQASLLLNSNLVKHKVSAATEGSRVRELLSKNPPESNAQIVEDLYLSTLSRLPTPSEIEHALKHIERFRDKGVEDLQWALINKLEFIVNH